MQEMNSKKSEIHLNRQLQTGIKEEAWLNKHAFKSKP